MPSPFPGMDPYLEHPVHWPGVHLHLIAAIQYALNRVVRPKYLAVVEERVFLSDDPDADRPTRIPDVQVRDAGRPAPAPRPDPTPAADGSVVIQTMPGVELRERYVAVVEAASRAVVTVIEVLSPTNKRNTSRGRGSYLRKRREVLRSDASLVEIDLLRAGTPTFPRPPGRPCEYAVHVSPPALRPRGRVWPIRLMDRLPVVGVPLAPPDPDAPLDLHAVLADAYDRGSLDGLADYAADPAPPLPPDLALWAAEQVRGRR